MGTNTSASLVSAICWGLLCGYAIFTILSLFGAPVGQFDDAIPLVHGLLVQQGRTPNLDFYSFYPPLSAYLNAGAFTVLGRSVLAARAVTAVLYLILLVSARQFFTSQLTRVSELLATVMLAFATSIGSAVSLPVFPGLALSLSTLFLYIDARSYQRHQLLAVSASGVLAAIALLYRVNFGAYAVLIIAVDLLLIEQIQSPVLRLKASIRPAVAFFVPLAVTSAVLCAWIYGKNSGVAVLEFVMGAQKLMALRGFNELRLSADMACAVVLPSAWFFVKILRNTGVSSPKAVLAAAIGICVLLIILLRGAYVSVVPMVIVSEFVAVIFLNFFVRQLRRAELSMLLFFCCLLHYFLSRADWMHWRLLPIGATLLLPFAALSDEEIGRPELGNLKGSGFAVIVAACFVMVAAETFRPVVSYAKSGANLIAAQMLHPHMADTEQVVDAHRPRSGWSTVYPDFDEIKALQYLRARTSNLDPIFVGVQDHSRMFWNDLRAYWLAARPIGVHTFQLEARVATEANVQQEITKDLQKNGVKWVVLNTAPPPGDDTFMRQGYRGSRILDEYLASHYQKVAEFGVFSVLKRQGRSVGDLRQEK